MTESSADETTSTVRRGALPRTTDWNAKSKVLVGTILMFAGFGVMGMAAIDLAIGLPIRLPHYWYPSRFLWFVVGPVIGMFGSRLVSTSGDVADWAPRQAGRRFQRVILYTRQECHLCEEALDVLHQYRAYLPPIDEVDIDKDAILIAQFTTCVPVVEIDGKIRFRGRVDEILLRRLIDGTPPQA